MMNSKSFALAAAFAAMLAAPGNAVEVSADARLAGAPEDMTIIKMIEDSAFKGNEVMTKDAKKIGLVDGVYNAADGSLVVLIALDSDIASKSSVKTFTVPLPADMVADGSLTLGWTEADLFKALSSNLEPADKS